MILRGSETFLFIFNLYSNDLYFKYSLCYLYYENVQWNRQTSPLLLENDRRRDINDLIILDPDSDRKSEPKML